MYGLEIPALQALIVGMAARDLNKVGNYEITHVCWIVGELELRHHTQMCTFTWMHTHQHIYALHRPTLASELAVLIQTDRAPRVTQTHQLGHPIKVLHTNPSPNPQQKSNQTHCHPHMTAGHHRIRVGPSPPTQTTYPPTQIRMKRLCMNDQFTSETKSLTGFHLSK